MSANAFQQLQDLLQEIEAANPANAEAIEQFRLRFLGSNNVIKPLMGEIRNVPNEQKKEFGQLINKAKEQAEAKFDALKAVAEAAAEKSQAAGLDITAPGEPIDLGSRHPVSVTLNRIVRIFERLGFVVAEEREIEDDWHNFSAMNTPADHPARDMQDTYYLRNSTEMLLRTHTSSVQARVMTSQKPPIRIIAPGRVYRNETISARSHCQFHQVEGLYIDKGVSFADMKQTLYYFAREMYGPNTKIRLRPSFFPFTEPSAEMDVSCFICNSKGCRVCKYSGWVEILGCGMVDPQVLINCGIDPEEYSGFAFGMGIERQAMMLYTITDIRLLFENDVRFLKQFSSVI
ncbi:MAG TPA: phenylalanine--tRNA ligase subunit alpha [Haliscomenobacter sp.]|uniref:phenylalanine--tRNA ligase subunit alpha n=1 Tax=Haliscomenobacter sp. TaxID=2717303 RepID=UPI001DE4767D|nr:phenylalanine--tRNA ligase subunit alpha [Haliscomenobacter sp.]MBK9487540.1 phenylalanine--tRNA ligase subunit alpha [Haliscomenobacter sp.]HOY16867.1 phenylalanine--tRNA ligase subunit alpha [Haliscomenobacter sp.]HPH18257.1 phenylalanine--tRNA ligase subunit alpha [Haliscomenobacter sp.]